MAKKMSEEIEQFLDETWYLHQMQVPLLRVGLNLFPAAESRDARVQDQRAQRQGRIPARICACHHATPIVTDELGLGQPLSTLTRRCRSSDN